MRTFLLGMLLFFSSAFAQDFVISEAKELTGKAMSPIDLQAFIEARNVQDSELLFQLSQDEITYLVFDVSGPSKESPLRYCGAGTEANLLWLKLEGIRLIAAQSVLYNSCTETVEGEFTLDDQVIFVSYTSYKWNKKYTLFFNPEEPADGFMTMAAEKLE